VEVKKDIGTDSSTDNCRYGIRLLARFNLRMKGNGAKTIYPPYFLSQNIYG